jgi:hypothetical protein
VKLQGRAVAQARWWSSASGYGELPGELGQGGGKFARFTARMRKKKENTKVYTKD